MSRERTAWNYFLKFRLPYIYSVTLYTSTSPYPDEQTDRQTIKQRNRQTDRWTDRRSDNQTDKRTDRQTDEQTDGQTDGQTKGQTGKRKHRRKTKWFNEGSISPFEVRNRKKILFLEVVSFRRYNFIVNAKYLSSLMPNTFHRDISSILGRGNNYWGLSPKNTTDEWYNELTCYSPLLCIPFKGNRCVLYRGNFKKRYR